ncbi:MAG: DUF4336 domain-containing protein [Pseudomonadota bacterium]
MIATGYEPLGTLKPVADDIWIIDGPAFHRGMIPFPTRATVVRLESGGLWVHSPVALGERLQSDLAELGPVAHLIATNALDWTHLVDWCSAYPNARLWAVPALQQKLEYLDQSEPNSQNLQYKAAEEEWSREFFQWVMDGGETYQEAVFFHRPSDTLIVGNMIAAIETIHLPAYLRPLVWLTGADSEYSNMPPAVRKHFRDKEKLADDVERLIGWGPKRIILGHGKWYKHSGVDQLERLFRRLLRNRRYEKMLNEPRKGPF